MKNKITDLNDHLFAQLERLGDERLKGDDLKAEIDRGKAITGIADKVISNAGLALEAHKLQLEYGKNAPDLPKMLEHK
ncbi:hypothetical protein [Methylophaga sp. OBS4]|uniref:hypothetical protein n=1 Tax=Methylophaga sp. OBS4 TaxID=2991935 RepID=UPI002257B76C|nr:hypothetical protein [Methylophaga sp. OBS4]MCX4187185.1 hypothetical protein [Methylophaga sp. OBS4]